MTTNLFDVLRTAGRLGFRGCVLYVGIRERSCHDYE
jgi:hypothetical protein